ncbi:MAG: sulfite exporter TauE/SafE family protein [Ferruginibacter sp.]|nr:sulfite exporter TauE/SafE family protein [Ferruginibacter sp.]MCB0708506.1 sulfite exporter TauE/SafE family protein [Chitinophagaceae bacterium]MCC7379164.1 sulfite exporter TauE/SafE family protein [Chitinophagaceae bacterium]
MNQKKTVMSTQMIIILIMVGIAAGVLSGLVGIGGGIIIVPALVYFLAFSQKMAQGTSLGILLLPIGLLGVIQYYKQGYIDIRVVVIISLAFFAGSYFGSKIALSLPQESLKKVFAVLMILISIKMLFFDSPKKTASTPSSEKTTITNQPNNGHT